MEAWAGQDSTQTWRIDSAPASLPACPSKGPVSVVHPASICLLQLAAPSPPPTDRISEPPHPLLWPADSWGSDSIYYDNLAAMVSLCGWVKGQHSQGAA